MRRGHGMESIATLVLFGLFAGSLLLTLLLGVKNYQQVVATMEDSYETATCLQYIATKVGHYSGEGHVSVTQFGEGSALALYETIDGTPYVTYLYLHDGQVKELFCEVKVDLEPEAGFSVMEMDQLTIQAVGDSLLLLTFAEEGNTAQLYVSLPGGGGI